MSFVTQQYQAVIGAPASGAQYATQRGWELERDCVVLSSAEELRQVDPVAVRSIIVLDLAPLGTKEKDHIEHELLALKALWPEIEVRHPGVSVRSKYKNVKGRR